MTINPDFNPAEKQTIGNFQGGRPDGAEFYNIGKLVSIQVFLRVDGDPGTIVHSSLVKHVGILEGFVLQPRGFQFKLSSSPTPCFVSYATEYVEIYVHDMTDDNKEKN